MPSIDSARILILATDGYERSELRVPHDELAARGAKVTVASLEKRPIKSWAEKDWGDTIDVDLTAKDVVVEDYDAIVLPGGQINPDILRKDADAMRVVKGFLDAGKIVAAICHAPWLLVEADALRGRKATSYASIKTDLKNAGADWRDEKVVNDNGIITSRSPDDLAAFVEDGGMGGAPVAVFEHLAAVVEPPGHGEFDEGEMVALAGVPGPLERGLDLADVLGGFLARAGIEGGEQRAVDDGGAGAVGDVEIGLVDAGDPQVGRQQDIGIGRGVERARQINRQPSRFHQFFQTRPRRTGPLTPLAIIGSPSADVHTRFAI